MFEGYLQIAIFVVVLVALIKPVGIYLARVFNNERTFLTPVFGGIERGTYRVLRVNPEGEGQDWKAYARSLIVFSLLFWDPPLPDPAHPGDPAVQPRRLPLGPLGPQLQHRLVVPHQHQLAVLRR